MAYIISDIKIPITLRVARNILYPIIKGISPLFVRFNAVVPIPSRPKIFSVIIAPEKSAGISPASVVTSGLNVFLNACLYITLFSLIEK